MLWLNPSFQTPFPSCCPSTSVTSPKAAASASIVIRERGYRSLLGKSELEKLGFTSAQQRAPGILIPLRSVDCNEAGCQFRPDHPRTTAASR